MEVKVTGDVNFNSKTNEQAMENNQRATIGGGSRRDRCEDPHEIWSEKTKNLPDGTFG